MPNVEPLSVVLADGNDLATVLGNVDGHNTTSRTMSRRNHEAQAVIRKFRARAIRSEAPRGSVLTTKTFPTTRPLTPTEFDQAVALTLGERRVTESMAEGVMYALEAGTARSKVFGGLDHFRRWLYTMARVGHRAMSKAEPKVASDATRPASLKGTALRYQSFECPACFPSGRVGFSDRRCARCGVYVPDGHRVTLDEPTRVRVARRLGLVEPLQLRPYRRNRRLRGLQQVNAAILRTTRDAITGAVSPNTSQMPGVVPTSETVAFGKWRIPGRRWSSLLSGEQYRVADVVRWLARSEEQCLLWSLKMVESSVHRVAFEFSLAESMGVAAADDADGSASKKRVWRQGGRRYGLQPAVSDDQCAAPEEFLGDYGRLCIIVANFFDTMYRFHEQGVIGFKTVVGRRRRGRGDPNIRSRSVVARQGAAGVVLSYDGALQRADQARQAFRALFKDDREAPALAAALEDMRPLEWGRMLRAIAQSLEPKPPTRNDMLVDEYNSSMVPA